LGRFRVEGGGWKVGGGRWKKKRRTSNTQTTFAAALKKSQSRVAKMEKGDPTESINKSVPVPPTRGFGY
jgi:hypothetical protein